MEINMEQPINAQSTHQSSQLVPPAQPVQQPIVQQPTGTSIRIQYIVIFLVLIVLGGGLFVVMKTPSQTPAPTPTDSPTPSQKAKPVIPIATVSAYIDLTSHIASLSSFIQNMNVSDTSMIPPTIELPLGFQNE